MISTSKRLTRVFLAPMLMACLLLFSSAGIAKAGNPSETVSTATNRILEQLKARRTEFQNSGSALDAFVRSELIAHLDQNYSARLVLGPHGRKASPEQIDAFASALSDNLLRRYGRALLEVDAGTSIKVTRETPLRDGKMVRVSTEVKRRAGAPIPVDYMMRPGPDGNWRAFDVIVEGISYVQTYRSQFDQPIRQRGLDKVIVELRDGKIQLDE